MPNNWKKYKLEDICLKITDGSHFSPKEDKNGERLMASVKDMLEYGFKLESCKRISETDYNNLVRSGCKAEKNDILFSKDGTIGEVQWFDGKNDLVLLSSIAILKPNQNLVDGKYLSYLLKNPQTNNYIKDNYKSGSALPRVILKEFRAHQITFPESLKEQQAIAEILSSLDDKIELNLDTNKTLEEMANALYKHWFVDFGPFKDGKFVESELGLIPEGWQVKGLDETAEFLNGLALQKFPPSGLKDLPVIKIREIKNGITNSTDYANNNLPEKYILKDGDIIFSWSGTLELVIWCNGPGALNQHLFKVTPIQLPAWLIYMYVNQHMENFKSIAANKATTMGHIQRIHLTEAKICFPNKEDLVNADKAISPIYDLIIKNNIENNSLKQTRDYLLPKLISGEILVKEASKKVKEVL